MKSRNYTAVKIAACYDLANGLHASRIFFSAHFSACWRVEGEVHFGEIASAKLSQYLVILHGRAQLLTEQAFFNKRRAVLYMPQVETTKIQ